jgi:hypothetical protein
MVMSIINDASGISGQEPATPSALFDDRFLSSIHNDPIGAVIEICDRGLPESPPERWDDRDLSNMIEAYALLQELEASGLIQIDIASPDLNGPFDDDCKKLIHFLSGVRRDYVPRRTERLLEVQRNRFRVSLGSGFFYEFTQGDLDRIQVLINELRTLISESEVFEADHQRRLLVRLEKLQAEMHKKVSDVDRFWGLFGEAGIALGKFGNDVKPIIDRVREIVDIVWRTQARAEELPSGTKPPLIEDKNDK